ncbi:MAG: PilZ domain-containing protein [Planctomycetota bacterium]|nr:PilZ domain-containing protein [Planctomycetota bacterium]
MKTVTEFLPEPPSGIYQFILRTLDCLPCQIELRARQRYLMTCTVVVVPLDDDGLPADAPFKCVTRDISTTGICLVHTRIVRARRLAVEFSNADGSTLNTIVEVTRCQSVGPFYRIGGVFVSRSISANVTESA